MPQLMIAAISDHMQPKTCTRCQYKYQQQHPIYNKYPFHHLFNFASFHIPLFVPIDNLFSISLGRQPGMLPHIFSEKGQIGKLQLTSYFLDAFGGMFHKTVNVLQHITVDDVGRPLIVHLFADGRQVFRGDVQAIRIIRHGALLGIGRFQQVDEAAIDGFTGSQGPLLVPHDAVQTVLHVIHEGEHQGVDDPLLCRVGILDFGTQKVIVLPALRPMFSSITKRYHF